MVILDPFFVLLQIHLASPVSCSSYLWVWTNFTQVYLTPLQASLTDTVAELCSAPIPTNEQPGTLE